MEEMSINSSPEPSAPAGGGSGRHHRHHRHLSARAMLLLGCGFLATIALAAGSGAPMVAALVVAMVLAPTAYRIEQQARQRSARAAAASSSARRPLTPTLAVHTK